MTSRTSRRARPVRSRPRESIGLSSKVKETYPVRVRSSDGYIECSPSLLAEISEETLQKPPSSLHLKLEIGGGLLGKNLSLNCGLPPSAEAADVTGVLIGRKEGSRTLITAFRRMAPRPAGPEAGGPSEKSERAFAGLVARVRWDPSLAGLQLVGWFRANPHALLAPSRRDLEIFNRFFPESWQVGLVLKPELGKIRARFVVREQDRSIDPQNGFQDVVVRWDPKARTPPDAMPAAPVRALPTRGPARVPPAKPASLWPAVAVLAVVLGTSWYLWRQYLAPQAGRQEPAAVADLRQEASRQAEVQWKQWEVDARRQAQQLPPQLPPSEPVPDLTPDNLGPSSRPASSIPHKADLPLAPAPETPAERRAWPANAKERLAAIRNQIRSSISTERPAPPVERAVAPSLSRQSASPVIASSSPSAPLPRADAPARLNPSAVPASEIPLPPPTGRDSAAPAQADPSALLSPPRAVPPPPASQPSRAIPPPPAAPRSGRLIWTGRLRKNEYLVFDGSNPSAGSATGTLPGRPVNVEISPGDLTKNGLVVYTERLPKAGAQPESPGPENGWNKTVYEWDPARTTDFEVVEAPSAANGWKRLVLRVRNPKHSIVMVEWKAQP